MIEVRNLTQTYPSGKGIFNVTFSIEEGTVYGYLGPNGAGKTTTIRNLLGFSNADQGSASIKEMDCRKEAHRIQGYLGYLPGEIAFFDHMKGLEFLNFIGNLRGMKEKKRRDELIERFEFDPSSGIRKMSKGMKQKIGIVAAFMHDPDIYILDEPTSGLDPLMQNRFLDLIDEEKKRGKTVLMSSHIFDEVQRSCDQVGIIREGRIVANETIQTITSMKEDNYVIQLRNASDVERLMKSTFSPELVGQKKVQLLVKQNYKELFALLADLDVIGMEARQQSLENVFMKYYGKAGDNNE